MGNKPSKPKTPFDILNVKPTSTREEVRLRFISLVKSNPKDLQEIVTAYDTIKKAPPPLDLYSDSLLATNGEDLFLKIGEFSGVSCPPFGTTEFFKAFLNFQCSRKFRNAEEKSEFIFKVKKVTRRLKRILKGEVEEIVKEVKVKGIQIVSIPKEFNCTNCKKGFRSTNQLLNHLKSKKHFKEIEKQTENPFQFIEEEISKLGIVGGEVGGDVIEKDIVIERDIVDERDPEIKEPSHQPPPPSYYTPL